MLQVANQFFNINTSEYLKYTPEYAILTSNNQKFSGEGDTPSLLPTLLGASGASILAPSALDVASQTCKPNYVHGQSWWTPQM